MTNQEKKERSNMGINLLVVPGVPKDLEYGQRRAPYDSTRG